jgi:hypothetical protein
VQIFEHDQHGTLGREVRDQRERLLEHAQPRAARPNVPQHAQRVDERLVRQFSADEIDAASDKDLEPGVAGAHSDLGCEPRLADARFTGDEGRRPAPLRRLV